MNKRGVSPVVATVLLIVLVVILAVIIFLWARGFLSESAVKGERAVQVSCADVEFNTQIVANAIECASTPGGTASVDINNIGNIPIFGVQVLRSRHSEGSIDNIPLVDQPFATGTVTIGESSYACLGITVMPQDAFRIVPKVLAEQDGKRIAYTCPESDGITVAYVGF